MVAGRVEQAFTTAFAFEIVLRFFTSLPEWRRFFEPVSNMVDLSLVILTAVIQIPIIHSSPAYPWLTAFQIMRFYRVILAIPRARRLLVRIKPLVFLQFDADSRD